MGAPATVEEGTVELITRASGTTSVSLLWSRGTKRASVLVTNASTGEYFELPIRAGDDALDVFNHPYAYAARPKEGYAHAPIQQPLSALAERN